jgi:hypothetical protein
MYEPYADYIARCKAPKDPSRIKYLIQCFVRGAKRGWSNAQIADRLNELKISTLVGKRWSPNNVAMAILKAVRFDQDSSLAFMLATMLQSGEVSEDDLAILKGRTRTAS